MTNLLKDDLHKMCEYCVDGSGYVIVGPNDWDSCRNVGVHAAIENEVAPALECAGKYEKLVTAVNDMETTIVQFTNKLQAIGEAIQNAGASLADVEEVVYSREVDSTIDHVRGRVLREMVVELHYPLDPDSGRCVCGEVWDDETLCAEARRVLSLADKFDPE